ncbi:MAG: hypothetical protein ACI35Y_06625 [Candidatus Limimorpha sp.]
MIGAASKIAEYFGLIEGVNIKVTKLLHQAFNSAKANLEYARNATGQNQIDYIKQARVEFNQAVAVEENENKILALVGLAMCQYLLGETSNANVTFDRISSVTLTRAEIVKNTAFMVRIYFTLGVRLSLEERVAHFELIKRNCLNKRLNCLQ